MRKTQIVGGIEMNIYKFRAWDKVKCFMYIPTQLELSQGENFGKWSEWQPMAWRDERPEEGNGGIGRYIGSECVLMQWTGLQDSNGQDIYDGDILRITSRFPMRKDVIIDRIRWFDSHVSYGTDEWLVSELSTNIRNGEQYIEVIGNTFEHPEKLHLQGV